MRQAGNMSGKRRLRAVLGFVGLIVLAACDGTPGAPTATPTPAANSLGFVSAPVDSASLMPPAGHRVALSGESFDLGSLSADEDATVVASATAEMGMPAFGKIMAAEQEGRIDHETALVYKVLETHDPEIVPVELRSDDGQSAQWSDASRNALLELVEGYDSLNVDVKARLDGLLERPTTKGSFWSRKILGAGGEQVDFKYIDAGEHIRMWYSPDGSDDEVSADLAQKLADEITGTDMWEVEKQIMLDRVPCSDEPLADNGGDGRLDMYLMPEGSLFPRAAMGGEGEFSAAGLTIPQARGKNGCPYVSYILLNTGMDYDYLRSAMAHELFHAYQFAFVQKISEAYFWWSEASATWVENVIYPMLNEEWLMLRPGKWANYDGQIGPVDKYEEGGYAQYGAYIWPLFLTNGPKELAGSTIGEIYRDGEKVNPLRVMSGVDDWEAKFKQFALWNWNKWPAKFYSDHGQDIKPLTQKAGAIKVKIDSGPTTISVQLDHASMRYFSVPLNGNAGTPGQISFDLSDLTGKKGAGVQAIIVTGSGEGAVGNFEDWSALEERNLCFQESAPPSQIVLVVSNSQIGAGKLTGKIVASAGSEWCPADVPTPESTRSPIVLPGLR